MTNFDMVLEDIEEMQYNLERKIEWVLTDSLDYDTVKTKVCAAQVALNDLYLFVMKTLETKETI